MSAPRVAVVTGAGRGIGRSIATALAAEGWQLGLLGRSADALNATLDAVRLAGSTGLAVAADVRVPAESTAAIDEIERSLGPIQALVNNAGVQRLAPALELTESHWDDVIDTNLKGAFFCAQAVGRAMIARGDGGSIVNISSAAGVVAVAERAPYAASKAGLTMLTKVLALEWAPHLVRVNAIAPTFVATELGRQTLDMPGRRDEIIGRIPLGRLATEDDVVAATRFLLDPQTSGFVTGHLLVVDGGLTL